MRPTNYSLHLSKCSQIPLSEEDKSNGDSLNSIPPLIDCSRSSSSIASALRSNDTIIWPADVEGANKQVKNVSNKQKVNIPHWMYVETQPLRTKCSSLSFPSRNCQGSRKYKKSEYNQAVPSHQIRSNYQDFEQDVSMKCDDSQNNSSTVVNYFDSSNKVPMPPICPSSPLQLPFLVDFDSYREQWMEAGLKDSKYEMTLEDSEFTKLDKNRLSDNDSIYSSIEYAVHFDGFDQSYDKVTTSRSTIAVDPCYQLSYEKQPGMKTTTLSTSSSEFGTGGDGTVASEYAENSNVLTQLAKPFRKLSSRAASSLELVSHLMQNSSFKYGTRLEESEQSISYTGIPLKESERKALLRAKTELLISDFEVSGVCGR